MLKNVTKSTFLGKRHDFQQAYRARVKMFPDTDFPSDVQVSFDIVPPMFTDTTSRGGFRFDFADSFRPKDHCKVVVRCCSVLVTRLESLEKTKPMDTYRC